ncbi:MAG: protein phosphatase CheZ [Gammaproteobacteria bacterium]|nr:protein phosphatase CheZ [Gammaproteobacteria bacterium]
MENKQIDKQALLEHAQALVKLLEVDTCTDAELEVSLDGIMALRENSLFHELGKMTREIHEAIMHFRMDSHMAELAETDIPDAKERLEYVITMTENAANTVLTVVEKSTPVAEKLSGQAQHLSEQWSRFRNRQLEVDELRAMGHEVESFFAESESMMKELLTGFNEVLMSQGFQDLTGQIIRRVIKLVDDIETNLVELIKIQGENFVRDEKKVKKQEGDTFLEGPQVPGQKSDDVMNGQDDVDDLLASLGF